MVVVCERTEVGRRTHDRAAMAKAERIRRESMAGRREGKGSDTETEGAGEVCGVWVLGEVDVVVVLVWDSEVQSCWWVSGVECSVGCIGCWLERQRVRRCCG